MESIFAEIDRGFAAAVNDLVEVCSFASTRDDSEGTLACAAWLRARFEKTGMSSQLLSVPGSNPVVYASIDGVSERRLLFVNHYDVETVGDLNAWDSPPFAPAVRDGQIYGRGTSDNKGNTMARLHAVEAVLRSRGALPCGVAFAVEAKTDIFAPHFEQIVDAQPELFRADACLWENALNDWDGRPTLRLGDKGMVALEVKLAQEERRALGSLYAAVAPGAAWELIWGLSALRPGRTGLPDWLREGATPLTDEERALLDDLPSEPVNQPLLIPDRSELARRLREEPTLNLSALAAGRPPARDAPLSSIPTEAAAYLDLRLLPGQDPDRIISALASHLDRAAPGTKLSVLGKLRPHRTPLDDPFIGQVRRAARRIWGADPRPEPLSTSSGSRYAIAKHFDIPIVGTGITYPGSAIARPNENARLEDYKKGIKFMAALLAEFGGTNPDPE